MSEGWTGRVAVVTGATSGIGEATARIFAHKGATVVFSGRSSAKGEAIAEDIRSSGGDAVFVTCDVTDRASIDAMFDTVIDRHGRIDFAVNNAGVNAPYTSFIDLDDALYDVSLDTNLRATMHCMQREIRQMLTQNGGTIVNTSSLASLTGAAGFATYAASKNGVNGLTRAAAVEFARNNIRVNAALPGVIATPMTGSTFDEAGQQWALSRIPMRRFGTLEEMAYPIVWLCSDEASYITGLIMPVDGGWEPAP